MLQGNPGAGRGFRFPAWRRLLRRCGEQRRRHAGCNAICGGPAMAGAAIGPRALRQATSVSDRSGAAPDHSERNPPPRSGRGRGIRRGSGLQRHGVVNGNLCRSRAPGASGRGVMQPSRARCAHALMGATGRRTAAFRQVWNPGGRAPRAVPSIVCGRCRAERCASKRRGGRCVRTPLLPQRIRGRGVRGGLRDPGTLKQRVVDASVPHPAHGHPHASGRCAACPCAGEGRAIPEAGAGRRACLTGSGDRPPKKENPKTCGLGVSRRTPRCRDGPGGCQNARVTPTTGPRKRWSQPTMPSPPMCLTSSRYHS